MRIQIRLIPLDSIAHYNLNVLANKYGWIYMDIIRGIYELPQAWILTKSLLAQLESNHGYQQVIQTPGLWRNLWRLISFNLVVKIFVIGYVGQ